MSYGSPEGLLCNKERPDPEGDHICVTLIRDVTKLWAHVERGSEEAGLVSWKVAFFTRMFEAF